jgi:hypothetical protein
MTAPRITDHQTKLRVLWAAQELLKRAGMDVVKRDTTGGCVITVTIPPDSKDIHGDRLEALRAVSS